MPEGTWFDSALASLGRTPTPLPTSYQTFRQPTLPGTDWFDNALAQTRGWERYHRLPPGWRTPWDQEDSFAYRPITSAAEEDEAEQIRNLRTQADIDRYIQRGLPPRPPELPWYDKVIPTSLRALGVVPPIAMGLFGGPAAAPAIPYAAGLSAMGAEGLATAYENLRGMRPAGLEGAVGSLGGIVAAGALGRIMPSNLTRLHATPWGQAAIPWIRAAEGAALGGVGQAGYSLASQGRLPSGDELGFASLLGATAGGAFGGVEGAFAGPPPVRNVQNAGMVRDLVPYDPRIAAQGQNWRDVPFGATEAQWRPTPPDLLPPSRFPQLPAAGEAGGPFEMPAPPPRPRSATPTGPLEEFLGLPTWPKSDNIPGPSAPAGTRQALTLPDAQLRQAFTEALMTNSPALPDLVQEIQRRADFAARWFQEPPPAVQPPRPELPDIVVLPRPLDVMGRRFTQLAFPNGEPMLTAPGMQQGLRVAWENLTKFGIPRNIIPERPAPPLTPEQLEARRFEGMPQEDVPWVQERMAENEAARARGELVFEGPRQMPWEQPQDVGAVEAARRFQLEPETAVREGQPPLPYSALETFLGGPGAPIEQSPLFAPRPSPVAPPSPPQAPAAPPPAQAPGPVAAPPTATDVAAADLAAGRPVDAAIPPPQGPVSRGNTVRMPMAQAVRSLKLDPRTYQFKESDAAGVTGALRGVQEWDPNAPPIMVHERADGSLYIADGHQRFNKYLELAKRGQVLPDLEMRVYREADGWTTDKIVRLASLRNIQEGTAKALDIARLVWNGGDLSPSELARIPVSGQSDIGAKFQRGFNLAKIQDPAARSMVINGEVNPEYAAAVGKHITDPELQLATLAAMRRANLRSLTEADEWVQAANRRGLMKKEPGQPVLFDSNDVAWALIEHEAKVAAAVKRELGARRSAFANVVKNAEELSGVGNVLIEGENLKQLDLTKRLGVYFDHLKGLRGSNTDQALATVVRGVADGSVSLDDAVRVVLRAVQQDLERPDILTSIATGTTERRGPGGPPPPDGAGSALVGPPPERGAETLEDLVSPGGPRDVTPEAPPEEPAPPSRAELEAAGQTSMFGATEPAAAVQAPQPPPPPQAPVDLGEQLGVGDATAGRRVGEKKIEAATPAPAGVTAETPAWMMTRREYHAHPKAQMAPKGSILAINPETVTGEQLLKYPLKDLRVLAQVYGVSKTGSKEGLVGRIQERIGLRYELRDATVESLEALKSDQLNRLLRQAGLSASIGNKHAKAVSLINRREYWRQMARQLIADARHESAVRRAVAAGEPVPERVLADYPDLKPAKADLGETLGVPAAAPGQVIAEATDEQLRAEARQYGLRAAQGREALPEADAMRYQEVLGELARRHPRGAGEAPGGIERRREPFPGLEGIYREEPPPADVAPEERFTFETLGGLVKGKTGPAPAAPPAETGLTHFRSGIARSPADFQGFVDARVPVGITATGLSPKIEDMAVAYVREGGKVFIDSGAFNAFTKGTPVDFDAILQVYQRIAARMPTQTRRNLFVVAPDIVGDAAATTNLQQRYAPEIQRLVDQGVQVVIPVQAGDVPNAKVLQQRIQQAIAPFGSSVVIGLPGNAAAISRTVLMEWAKTYQAPANRVHLFGVGDTNLTRDLAPVLKAQGITLSSDSNRVAAIIGKDRPVGKQIATQVEEAGAEAVARPNVPRHDETEIFGELAQGNWNALTPAEWTRLAERLDLPVAEVRARWAELRDDPRADFAITQIANQRGRRDAGPGIRTRAIAEHERTRAVAPGTTPENIARAEQLQADIEAPPRPETLEESWQRQQTEHDRAARKVDVNEFGEAQPRLPGATDVRELAQRPEPPIADVPFTLQREASAAPETTQPSLLEVPEAKVPQRASSLQAEGTTAAQIPGNVLSYLTKRLGWSVEQINALTPDDAILAGREQRRPPQTAAPVTPVEEGGGPRGQMQGRQGPEEVAAPEPPAARPPGSLEELLQGYGAEVLPGKLAAIQKREARAVLSGGRRRYAPGQVWRTGEEGVIEPVKETTWTPQSIAEAKAKAAAGEPDLAEQQLEEAAKERGAVRKDLIAKRIEGGQLTEQERQSVGEKQTARPNEAVSLRAEGVNPRMNKARAERMQQLLADPSRKNLDEYINALMEQVARENEAQFKAGTTAEPKGPGGEAPKFGDDLRHLKYSSEYGEYLGSGLGGLQALYERNPAAFWLLMRTGAGVFGGAAIAEATGQDDPLAWALMGGALGATVSRASYVRLAGELKKMGVAWEKVRKMADLGVPEVRRPRNYQKDISKLTQFTRSLHAIDPELFGEIFPAFEAFRRAEAELPSASPAMYGFMRKIYLEEAISQVEHAAKVAGEAGQANHAQYLRKYARMLRGEPTVWEKAAQEIGEGVTGKKVTVQQARKFWRATTNWVYFTTLGFAVDSAAKNLTQFILAYPYVGIKPLAKAIAMQLTRPEEVKELTEFLRLPRTIDIEGPEIASRGAAHRLISKISDASFAPMSWSDFKMRTTTYLAARDYALAKGLAKEAAHDWALEITMQTQGIPGDLGGNPYHRQLGPLRALGKYPALWSEFAYDIVTHPDPRVKARALGLALGATALGSVVGMNVLQLLFPRLDYIGPAWEMGKELGSHTPGLNQLIGPATHGIGEHLVPRSGEMTRTADWTIPRYARKVADIVQRRMPQAIGGFGQGAGERTVYNRQGRKLEDRSLMDDLLSLAGQRTGAAEQRLQRREDLYQYERQVQSQNEGRLRTLYRDLSLAIERGDLEQIRELEGELSRQQRQRFYKEREMTPEERTRRRLPKAARPAFDERFQDQQQ